MYDCVSCCALSSYFSLHSDNKCSFARVIDDYVSRTSDLLCIHLNYTSIEQGLVFMVVASLRHLHTISKGKERKYRSEILPVEKPYCLHWT